METQTSALSELQGLLGHTATDDTIWRDVRSFEQAALTALKAHWPLQEEAGSLWSLVYFHTDDARIIHDQRVAAASADLCAAFGEQLPDVAASFYLHPQLWQAQSSAGRHNWQEQHQRQVQIQLLNYVASACLSQRPSDWAARLAQRIITLCSARSVVDEPNLATCVASLLPIDTGPVSIFLNALTIGAWEAALSALGQIAGFSIPAAQPAVERLRDRWQAEGEQHSVALLRRHYLRGTLDLSIFRQLLEALPYSLRTINAAIEAAGIFHGNQDSAPQTLEPDFRAMLRSMIDAALWELLCDLRPETWATLWQIGQLSGGRVLLRLAEEVDRRQLTHLSPSNYRSDQVAAVVARLVGVLARRDDDNSASLIELLQHIETPALLAVLPYTQAYEPELCAALGWPGCAALVGLVRRLENGNPARSTDPHVGVVRRQEVLDILAGMDEEHIRVLLDTFAQTTPAAVMLVRAVLGWNRADIRRLVGRRNQLAVRALPLLPFTEKDGVLQRYLSLTRYQREINSSTPSRKSFERAAAQAALSNLAYHAGYSDAIRLEWAMGDVLGSELVALGRVWEIEGYTLTLVLRNSVPALEIRSPKKLLKRIPSVVARDYAYREVRATLEQAQDHERRYREAFLAAMRNGQSLSPEELALLRRNPLATALLERLVLIDEAGAIGMFKAEDLSLEGVHGERLHIQGAVTIAHPYTLEQEGLLAAWQAEIVRRQIVQPFKQVFRELYILTPAEQAAVYSSGRLAGRRLKSRQAVAVLAAMGWIVDGYGMVSKPFYEQGLTAYFETGSYYDDHDDAGQTGMLSFWPLTYDYSRRGDERRIVLENISPLVFSEVMRDLDLVTVIAHQSEERGTSQEVVRQRADLVRATVSALGFEQVRVEEPFVYVRGARSGYRIHLATAAIYLDSGQYLCIVPSPKQRQAIYLPFEDGGEPISSEIISKVLLLANDTAITDTTILAQIPSVRQAA